MRTQVRPHWDIVPGALEEDAEGQVFESGLPVTATPVVVGAAGAIVVAYAAGALANALGNGTHPTLPHA